MIRTLRSLLIYTSLGCYALAAFVGQGLHEWTGCEHASTDAACCSAQKSGSAGHDEHAHHQHSHHNHARRGHVCRHHHGSSDHGSSNHGAIAQKTEQTSKSQRSFGWNATRTGHDHHNCLICQFQAQGQLVVAAADTGHFQAIVVSSVFETSQFFSAQDHEPYAPRGPPLAV